MKNQSVKKIKPLTVTLFCSLILTASIIPSAFVYASEKSSDFSEDEEVLESSLVYVDKKDPYLMIEKVASKTFKRFADELQAIKAEPNIIKNIIREELMPYINYQYSAFKVIGKHLPKTTEQERKDFVPVFREYLVTSYAQVFTLYNNQPVEFSPSKDFSENRIVSVDTRIIMTGRDNIDVSFKVRKNRKTGDWKAYDMVAEGVSLLDTKQAELGSVIRQKGLSYVTELLKEKSDRDIVFKD